MGRRSSWQFAQQEKERKEAQKMNPVWRGGRMLADRRDRCAGIHVCDLVLA